MNAIELPAQTTTTTLENLFATVIHSITDKSFTNYKKSSKYPQTREVWTTVFGKEWVNLAQGDVKIGTKGTNSLFVQNNNKIRQIPTYRTVMYVKIVVDYRS